MEDPLFAGLHALLAADPREERREAVVILLAPFLERMMMAAGALNPQPEEELGRVFHLLVDLLHLAIPGDRRILAHFARSGQNVADELIVGLVLVQALANPIVEQIRAVGEALHAAACCGGSRSTCWRSSRRSRRCPRAVDPLLALGRIGVGQKLLASPRRSASGRRCRSLRGGGTSRRRKRPRAECPAS